MMRLPATLFLLCISALASAQIKIDSSFAVNGWTTNGPKPDGTAAGIAIQSDGKIVVPAAGSTQYSRLYRFKTNGSLDSTFGVNGYAKSPDLTYSFSYIKQSVWTNKIANIAAAVQPDGKIVTCGDLEFCGQIICGSQMPVLTRWKSNGTVDSTFGTNGILVPLHNLNGGAMYYAQLTGMKSAGGGKLYVMGYEWYDNFIARLNPDGSFDNTFGAGGFCHFPFCDTARDTMCLKPTSFALDTVGNIYAVGAYSAENRKPSGGVYGYYVLKISPNGTLDPAFGNSGMKAYWYAPIITTKALCVRGDGKIVVAGSVLDSVMSMQGDCFVSLLDATGNIVSSMLPTGYVRMGKDQWNDGTALLPDSTNSALLAMSANHYITPGYYDTTVTYILRLSANGKVDTTWPNKGVLTLTVKGTRTVQIGSMTAAANNKIVLAGALHYATGGDPITLLQLKRASYATPVPNSVHTSGSKGDLTITAYPNPASLSVTLNIAAQSPQSIRVVLTDMQGREARASALHSLTAGSNDIQIPMGNLPAGQYFYRLINDKGVMVATGAVIRQ